MVLPNSVWEEIILHAGSNVDVLKEPDVSDYFLSLFLFLSLSLCVSLSHSLSPSLSYALLSYSLSQGINCVRKKIFSGGGHLT